MSWWTFAARSAAPMVIAFAASAGHAAAKHEEALPQATPGNVSGYGVKLGGFFTDKNKEAVKKAFAQHFAKSKDCPDDMDRKGKACHALVPGHYWAVGQPLRTEVKTFELPQDVAARLPKPPEGYEYVRAGDDVLLLSNGLHLVVDVMEDVAG
jgi:Ni/Co efflux regulator RcnB